jgi:hypothetical protein
VPNAEDDLTDKQSFTSDAKPGVPHADMSEKSFKLQVIDWKSDAPVSRANVTMKIFKLVPIEAIHVASGVKKIVYGNRVSPTELRKFVTDKFGNFDFSLPCGTDEKPMKYELSIFIEHDGYLPYRSLIKETPPHSNTSFQIPDNERILRLKQGRPIEVRFLLRDGTPVENVPVMISRNRDGNGGGELPRIFHTDSSGRVEARIEDSWPQRIHWFPDEYQWDSKALTKNFGDQGTIPLKPGPRLQGTIHDHDGNPLSGIAIRATTGTRVPHQVAISDNQGCFSFHPMPPGRYSVRPVENYTDFIERKEVTSALLIPFGTQLVEVASGNDDRIVDFVAPQTTKVRVRVCDKNGNPLKNQRVEYGGWLNRRYFAELVNDPGNYEILVPHGDPYSNEVTLIGHWDEVVLFQKTESSRFESRRRFFISEINSDDLSNGPVFRVMHATEDPVNKISY